MDTGKLNKFAPSTRIAPLGPPRAEEPPSFWRRNARLLLGIALGALLVHDIFGAHGLLALRRTQQDIAKLRNDINALDRENQDLSDQVKALKTDPRVIEKIAREEMGLAKRGEKIFKLPPPVPPSK